MVSAWAISSRQPSLDGPFAGAGPLHHRLDGKLRHTKFLFQRFGDEEYLIESSKAEDAYGFVYQRLVSEPTEKQKAQEKPKFVVDYDPIAGRAVLRPA